MSIEIIICR